MGCGVTKPVHDVHVRKYVEKLSTASSDSDSEWCFSEGRTTNDGSGGYIRKEPSPNLLRLRSIKMQIKSKMQRESKDIETLTTQTLNDDHVELRRTIRVWIYTIDISGVQEFPVDRIKSPSCGSLTNKKWSAMGDVYEIFDSSMPLPEAVYDPSPHPKQRLNCERDLHVVQSICSNSRSSPFLQYKLYQEREYSKLCSRPDSLLPNLSPDQGSSKSPIQQNVSPLPSYQMELPEVL